MASHPSISPSALPTAFDAVSKPKIGKETYVSNPTLLTIDDTLRGGKLLGVVRPFWHKIR